MKVGDDVYLEPLNNAAIRSNESIKTTITKIGRKYITVEKWDCKFFKDTMMHFNGDYGGNYRLYFSEQDLLDKQESVQISREIGFRFSNYFATPQFSLSALRQIKEIIDNDKI